MPRVCTGLRQAVMCSHGVDTCLDVTSGGVDACYCKGSQQLIQKFLTRVPWCDRRALLVRSEFGRFDLAREDQSDRDPRHTHQIFSSATVAGGNGPLPTPTVPLWCWDARDALPHCRTEVLQSLQMQQRPRWSWYLHLSQCPKAESHDKDS